MGGGIGMGNTCKPMAVSFQCMTKFTTKKKKKAWPSQERENEKIAFRDVAGSISQAVKWRYITKNAEQLNAN